MNRSRTLLNSPQPVTTQEFFRALCRDVSENLDADKTSVWTFDRDLSQIECQCNFDALSGDFTTGLILKRADYPIYFQKIVDDTFVLAPHAQTQAVTREFVDSYFKPQGIVSLLDFILHDEIRPFGVICCENRRAIRNWSADDQKYLRSLATMTSFLFLPRKKSGPGQGKDTGSAPGLNSR
jgi:GAF domain-containing protein